MSERRLTETVSTPSEFDALPVGSVIRREKDPEYDLDMPVAAEKIGPYGWVGSIIWREEDPDVDWDRAVVAEKVEPDRWMTTRGSHTTTVDSLLRDETPYTVLYRPDRPVADEPPSRGESTEVERLAQVIARCRTGGDVFMDGSHHPRPSELTAARGFLYEHDTRVRIILRDIESYARHRGDESSAAEDGDGPNTLAWHVVWTAAQDALAAIGKEQ